MHYTIIKIGTRINDFKATSDIDPKIAAYFVIEKEMLVDTSYEKTCSVIFNNMIQVHPTTEIDEDVEHPYARFLHVTVAIRILMNVHK